MKQIDQTVVIMVAAVAGAILLFLLPKSAVWALANLPWVPWDGPLKLLITGEQMLTRWGVAAIGAVLGVLSGVLIIHDEPIIIISSSELLVHRGGKRHRFARAQVNAVGIINRHLVIRDHSNVELLYVKIDQRSKIEAALRARDWPKLYGK
ncbi:hypothetical protein [Rhizobium lusitanum]|uniref:YqeB PH domain-containing protein n=1 Tax=Rhizobium lusitanum TaxID=293958 RepID=A0A7X0IRR5_9HYPH|nr:hypothetical protein [Rhizobium lusitanum]MBB6485940.1 hypothetical protein [Rhizobium lusitanum]